MVKSNYKFEHIINAQSYSSFEHSTIKLHLENDQYIFSTSIHKPPDKKLNTSELSTLIDAFKRVPFVIGGDFNCIHTHCGNAENKSEGNKLFKWYRDSIDRHKLYAPKTNEPTCVRANFESFIDIFLVDDGLHIKDNTGTQKLETLHFASDHRAVVLQITISDKVINNEPKSIYNWAKTNFIVLI